MSRTISHQHHCVIGTVPDLRSAAIHKSEFRSSCCSGQANICEELTSSICVIVLLSKNWWYTDAPLSTTRLSTEGFIDTESAGKQALNTSFNIYYYSLLKNLTLFDLPLGTNIFVRVTVTVVTIDHRAIIVRVSLWKVFCLTRKKKAQRFFRPSVTFQRHVVICHEA
jgi:hypothetical protein